MNMAVENFIFMNLERSMEMMSVPPDVAPKVFPNTIRPIIISGISIIRPNVPVCIEGTR